MSYTNGLDYLNDFLLQHEFAQPLGSRGEEPSSLAHEQRAGATVVELPSQRSPPHSMPSYRICEM